MRISTWHDQSIISHISHFIWRRLRVDTITLNPEVLWWNVNIMKSKYWNWATTKPGWVKVRTLHRTWIAALPTFTANPKIVSREAQHPILDSKTLIFRHCNIHKKASLKWHCGHPIGQRVILQGSSATLLNGLNVVWTDHMHVYLQVTKTVGNLLQNLCYDGFPVGYSSVFRFDLRCLRPASLFFKHPSTSFSPAEWLRAWVHPFCIWYGQRLPLKGLELAADYADSNCLELYLSWYRTSMLSLDLHVLIKQNGNPHTTNWDRGGGVKKQHWNYDKLCMMNLNTFIRVRLPAWFVGSSGSPFKHKNVMALTCFNSRLSSCDVP